MLSLLLRTYRHASVILDNYDGLHNALAARNSPSYKKSPHKRWRFWRFVRQANPDGFQVKAREGAILRKTFIRTLALGHFSSDRITGESTVAG